MRQLDVARLHEYQGKALLRQHGVIVPDGRAVRSPEEARNVTAQLGGRAILKAQAWITGRKARGGVVVADSPDHAAAAASALLALRFGNFPVTEVLVEQLLEIRDELFVSLTIDDALQ
ncbi:MAG: ATP-grasp domain-containing protein, partial [Planctomycetota bacterium]